MTVQPGQPVSVGEIIGAVGNTGRTYGKNGGYHLHYEIIGSSDEYPLPWNQTGPMGVRGKEYRVDPVEIFRQDFTTATTGAGSPIVLDLDGDGVETTNVKDGSYFDHDGNGFAEQTGWAGADDGILVRDINGTGSIDNGKELFGDHTLLGDGTRASNGFQALAELDDNLDGKIDATDAAFAQLKVWKDIDGDGYSSTDELKSLSDAGVTSINTGYTDSTLVDAQGNEHRQVGSFAKTDGATGTATDVWFKKDTAFTIATEWLDVPEDIAALPDLQGYGNVYDLQQAMVRGTDRQLAVLAEDKTYVREFLLTSQLESG